LNPLQRLHQVVPLLLLVLLLPLLLVVVVRPLLLPTLLAVAVWLDPSYHSPLHCSCQCWGQSWVNQAKHRPAAQLYHQTCLTKETWQLIQVTTGHPVVLLMHLCLALARAGGFGSPQHQHRQQGRVNLSCCRQWDPEGHWCHVLLLLLLWQQLAAVAVACWMQHPGQAMQCPCL
jgi:hypothetical protein